MSKKATPRVAFYARIPKTTAEEIRRRVTYKNPQWAVVRDAVEATRKKAR